MKKLYTLFATVLLMALGFNCTKPGYINCEAFNSPLFDQWIPYKNNATYNYSTGSNTESYISLYCIQAAERAATKDSKQYRMPAVGTC